MHVWPEIMAISSTYSSSQELIPASLVSMLVYLTCFKHAPLARGYGDFE
jgi:hypothetical protein